MSILTIFVSILYETNRSLVSMGLLSKSSLRMSKCDKNISYALCAPFLFLPSFDVICDV